MSISKKERYLKRLDELGKLVENATYENQSGIHTAYHSCRNIIHRLYGQVSEEAEELIELWSSKLVDLPGGINQFEERQTALLGLLHAIQGDIELDLVGGIKSAHGAVLVDFALLAKEQLDNGYKDVAAVLASAAFEDAMKRKAKSMAVQVEGADLQKIVNALKAQGTFRGAQPSLLGGFIKLRNNAMHADWSKIESAEVGSLIAFVEVFLLTQYS